MTRGIAWVLGAVSRRPGSLAVRFPGKGIEGVVKRGFDYDDWIKGGGQPRHGPWTVADVNHIVLVVHGIGQKLSERVETFDFTYAINTFRVLMAKQHRSMPGSHPPPTVLPINWRRKINFDYEEVTSERDQNKDGADDPVRRAFSLADITPPTIPTVRNIISDVLLDIPYYLSKHRPRVLHAVTAEANRIYRLWMRNNPGWQGKVSIIGHSLGSVIAVDILSRQPTVPPPVFSQNEHNADDSDLMLEFSVRNLFVAGSPVGFFLLLNKSNLIPRIMSTERLVNIAQHLSYSEQDVADQAGNPTPIVISPSDIGLSHGGEYGCLAVENIYNVIHTSDPVAYRLNPAVDPEFAQTIERVDLAIPLPQEGFLTRIFSLDTKAKTPLQRKAIAIKNRVVQRAQPSRTYSFTRGPTVGSSYGTAKHQKKKRDRRYERLVHTRFYSLNENGQIDYVIHPTGALENQYISILTAHSGYWESKEFAYLVAAECSRPEGVENTLEEFRVKYKQST
ncbi:DDHD domain-containing protein [Lipomyces oligophaga]|uniref:DDHD domain-containing protein n=1 Tax=Lipomyces oligophaga TaxID=45792 RepID=UPI0034CF4334